MKGKEYTKVTAVADVGQAQQLTEESYFSKSWEAEKEEKHTYRWKIRISRSMVIFLVLDFLSIVIASFASIWIRYEFQIDMIEQRFVDSVIWYMPINIFYVYNVVEICRNY